MSHNDFRTRICIIFTITTEAIMKKESTLLHMPEALSSPESSIKIQNADSEVIQLYQMNAPFQLTLEYCSGTGVEDYVNIVTMSPERSILYQETLPEKNRCRTKAIPHFHDYFEFAVVLEGSILQVIEGKEYLYTSGSCCLLNRSLCHLEHYHSRSKVLFIGMSPDFAMELFRSAQNSSFQCEKDFYNSDIYRFIASDLKNPGKKEYIDFIPTYQNNRNADHLHAMAETMLQTLLYPSFGAAYQIRGLLCSFLSYLSSPQYYHCTNVNLDNNSDFLIFARISHLFEESDGRMPRAQLEQLLNYSGDYLNRIVNRYTGLCLFDYGMTFCLKKAAQYLSETDESVSSIATKLHFSNRTHFYALFKAKYGVTPKEFRDASNKEKRKIKENTYEIKEQELL